jgi:hypothetical protein
MKKIVSLCIVLLMLAGCSTKIITTSDGKLDMSQLPPIFSEKRDYQTAWMTDNQMAAAIATTVLFGVPIITTTNDDDLLGVNAQEVLDRIIPMSVLNDATVTSTMYTEYTDGKILTDNSVKVYMRYRENNVAGLEINITPEVMKETIPVYTTYMEVVCEKECALVKENIGAEEVSSKQNAYLSRTLEKRQGGNVR